jgi:hypothetical protein
VTLCFLKGAKLKDPKKAHCGEIRISQTTTSTSFSDKASASKVVSKTLFLTRPFLRPTLRQD